MTSIIIGYLECICWKTMMKCFWLTYPMSFFKIPWLIKWTWNRFSIIYIKKNRNIQSFILTEWSNGAGSCIHFLCLSRSVSRLFPMDNRIFFSTNEYQFSISILPRKSVYNAVSGVIDPQIRPLSSSASKHSPKNRENFY